MKTLDEIISRNDYKKANKALRERAGQLAVIFRDKMMELGISFHPSDEVLRKDMAISVNNHTYTVKEQKWYDNGTYYKSDYYFARVTVESEFDEFYHFSYFDTNAHNFICNGTDNKEASNQQYVEFLNDARSILVAIDEMETKKVEEINKLLNGTQIP